MNDPKEQLELYLQVASEMNEEERTAISAQILHAKTVFAQLKRLLFPPASNEMTELEILQSNHDESCSATTVDQRNTTMDEYDSKNMLEVDDEPMNIPGKNMPEVDDEPMNKLDKNMPEVVDEPMNIQEIVDEGIDHVIQELHSISQSQ